MKTIVVVASLEYDDSLMHGDNKESEDWFFNQVLKNPEEPLLLHSNDVGDTIGTVEVLKVVFPVQPVLTTVEKTPSTKEYIPLKKMKHYHLYHIDGRNAGMGIWDETKEHFIIARCTFGYTFLSGAPHGTAKPLAKIEPAPAFTSGQEMLDYLQSWGAELE